MSSSNGYIGHFGVEDNDYADVDYLMEVLRKRLELKYGDMRECYSMGSTLLIGLAYRETETSWEFIPVGSYVYIVDGTLIASERKFKVDANARA